MEVGSFCPNIPFLVPYFQCSVDQKEKKSCGLQWFSEMETGFQGVSALQEEDKSVDELDSDVSYVTVMVIIRNMLKLDYMMQVNCVHVSEWYFAFILCILRWPHHFGSPFWVTKIYLPLQERIVSALSIKAPSLELQSYCLMWDLRPYIDDNVMHLAWKMCPWSFAIHSGQGDGTSSKLSLLRKTRAAVWVTERDGCLPNQLMSILNRMYVGL